MVIVSKEHDLIKSSKHKQTRKKEKGKKNMAYKI